MVTVVEGPDICLASEERSSELSTTQHAEPSTQPLGQGGLDSLETPGELDELEAATSLEWFRSTFSQVEKNGVITLKDFRHRAKKDQFAEHLFNLLDTEDTGSIGLQELMGGMGRLLSQSRKRGHLKWFEELFIQISGDDDQPIQMTDFKAAVHTEHFLDKLYNLLVTDNEELTLTVMLNAFNNILSTDKDHRWLEWFEQKFSSLPEEIDFDQFKKILHIKESFFAERFFHIFDKDKTEHISRRELKEGVLLLTSGSEVDKLRFLFQIYDIDGSGHILFEELRTVLKSCMGESALQFSDDQLNELTQTLFEDADATNSGSITFEELQSALSRHPGLVENLTFSAANWFQPGKKSRRRRRIKRVPHWMRPYYLRNNLTWIIWLALFYTINVILFLEASILYRNEGTAALSIARGSGQCLNFTSTFVIILMFRHLLTWIRSTSLHFLFPLDESIKFHKLVGWTTLFLSIVHIIAHIVNFTLVSLKPDGLPLWQYFFYVETGFGWVYGTAGLTGILLSIIFVIMALFALSCVRRKGFFEVFYWTHHLFIAWYILLILHATDFWKWFLVPGLVYIIERIIRSKWIKLARYGRFYVKSARTLPSKVTYLALTRPRRFNYQPGDYVFIKIPSIAKTEWHPFTISSSPEQDFIGLHVRAVGTWTNKLYELIDKRNKRSKRALEPATSGSKEEVQIELAEVTESQGDDQSAGVSFDAEAKVEDSLVCESNETNTDTIVSIEESVKDMGQRMEVFIDGPYGSPSFHIFQAEHAVLIGAGIGVTPFASILQSIASKYRSVRQICPRCHHGWTGEIPSAIMRLRKVDFFWINRDQRSFEWFVRLLTSLEIEESDRELNSFERFLDFHLYMTSALRKTDMKAIGLQMALDLLHKKENRDLITGLRTRTQTGRPDWEKVFQYLSNVKKGKVSVFFCGPSAISKVLKAKCAKYRFEFRKEHF